MSINDYMPFIQEFMENILSAMDRMISSSKFDRTFKAIVAGKVDDGKYKILYNGKEYTVSSSIVLQVNQIVYVCAPCNNWSDLFVVGVSNSKFLQK